MTRTKIHYCKFEHRTNISITRSRLLSYDYFLRATWKITTASHEANLVLWTSSSETLDQPLIYSHCARSGCSTLTQTLRPGMRLEQEWLISAFQHSSWLMVNVLPCRAMISQQVSPVITVSNPMPVIVLA